MGTLAAVCVGAPGHASADGDPASDYLLFNTLYTPVDQPVAPASLERLQAAIGSANDSAFRIRVAVILDRSDLGSYPQLLGHPQHYANLLAIELKQAYRSRVLVVMAKGFGFANVGSVAAATRETQQITIDRPVTATSLADAGTAAVEALSSASRKPVRIHHPSRERILEISLSILAFVAITVALMQRLRAGRRHA